MTTARNAACWISKLFRERKSEEISEIVLHKLLYFSQREALIADRDSPLFPEAFEAWKYGPVMPLSTPMLTRSNTMILPSRQEVPYEKKTKHFS